jgi:phage terminase Nu1 subunit (DNA packaging protein)
LQEVTLLTRKEFAELCEVTGAAITQAVKSGIVRKTEDGTYDPRDTINHEYIKAALVRGRTRRRKDEARPTDGDPDDLRQLEIQDLQEKIRYTTERADERALMNAKRRGELVPTDVVIEYASNYATGVRTYLLQIGNRLSPRILAAAKSGAELEEIQEMIEAETADAIERSLAMGDAAVTALAEQMPDEPEEESEEELEEAEVE